MIRTALTRFSTPSSLTAFKANMSTASATSTAGTSRSVTKAVYAHEVSEGVGATVRRSIGTRELRNLTPFLMLDHFKVLPGAGFPDHPHRGMQTVTYLFRGTFKHEDFLGYSGTLTPGDVQWMTAGKGIAHAEMPIFDPDPTKAEPVEGMQLWIDLPQKDKYIEPEYQDRKAEDIPVIHPKDGIEITVLSGDSHGTNGSVTPVGGAWYLGFKLQKPGASVYQPLPEGYNAFIYIVKGKLQVGDDTKAHDKFNLLVLSAKPGESGVTLTRPADDTDAEEAHFVVVAGKPLDQPIVQYGPFVTCSQRQAMEAIMDYQTGKNGFERAVGWKSKIAKDFRG
ncbi:pirin [Cryptococcus neoformans Bt1]|nr:pirin [Cryptococcus neoformans var. grubii Bt1]OXG13430.1 pirin [Cryptococcus neoformans var. grubii Ze90-1]